MMGSEILALLTTRPGYIPVGVGRVHRMDDDEEVGPEVLQRCTSCENEYSLDYFYKRAANKTHNKQCKACERIESQKRKARRVEKC